MCLPVSSNPTIQTTRFPWDNTAPHQNQGVMPAVCLRKKRTSPICTSLSPTSSNSARSSQSYAEKLLAHLLTWHGRPAHEPLPARSAKSHPISLQASSRASRAKRILVSPLHHVTHCHSLSPLLHSFLTTKPPPCFPISQDTLSTRPHQRAFFELFRARHTHAEKIYLLVTHLPTWHGRPAHEPIPARSAKSHPISLNPVLPQSRARPRSHPHHTPKPCRLQPIQPVREHSPTHGPSRSRRSQRVLRTRSFPLLTPASIRRGWELKRGMPFRLFFEYPS